MRNVQARQHPRIIFVNRFFYPDHSATSQMLSDLAFHLASCGEEVHVIAGRQSYDDPASVLPARETISGVKVHRVSGTRYGRRSGLGRMFDYASFHAAASVALLRIARRGDIVVAKTDPPLLSVPAHALGKLRGFKTVNWLQDLYPEIAAALGVRGLEGRSALLRFLAAVRNRSLRRATMNVAVGKAMAERLRDLGVAQERIEIVANWADDAAIRPTDVESNPLYREWQLAGKFVIAHSGNLGRAHDSDTILAAAESLRARADIVFLMIGGGDGYRRLAAEVEKRGLSNFRFEPYQPRDRLGDTLGVAHVHWLSLKPGLDGLLLPSKFYGIAAAGRAVIVIGSAEGELAQLVAEFSCGFCVPPGRPELLAGTLLLLEADRPLCATLGANARRMLDTRLTRSFALERWHEILRSASGPAPERRSE